MEVLGGLLLEPSRLAELRQIPLDPIDFFGEERGALYCGILELHAEDVPVDLVSLGHRLQGDCGRNASEWEVFCTELWREVPTAANILHHAKTVRKLAVQRRLARDLATLGEAVLRGTGSLAEAAETLSTILDELRRADATSAGWAKAPLYSVADLCRGKYRELLPLDKLPHQHGLGGVDALLDGGLAGGDVLVLGADVASAGTAFVLQVEDGLALRADEVARGECSGPLTPVFLVSKLPSEQVARHALARLTRAAITTFRSGVGACDTSGSPKDVDTAYAEARELVRPGGAAHRLFAWQRVARPKERHLAMLERLGSAVEGWRIELVAKHQRELVPVVVIDRIERWRDLEQSEVSAISTMMEELDAMAKELGWVVVVTTTMGAATAIMDGSDIALSLEVERKDDLLPPWPVTLEVLKSPTGKLGRVPYRWHVPMGWFEAEVVHK
jgi:replicative DNA helicase